MNRSDFEAIISHVKYRDWTLKVGQDGDRCYLQVVFYEEDSITGKVEQQSCRKWMLSEHMVAQEVIRTAYKAIEAATLHEMSENFRYKGRAIYGPHIDPEALWKVARMVDYRGKA